MYAFLIPSPSNFSRKIKLINLCTELQNKRRIRKNFLHSFLSRTLIYIIFKALFWSIIFWTVHSGLAKIWKKGNLRKPHCLPQSFFSLFDGASPKMSTEWRKNFKKSLRKYAINIISWYCFSFRIFLLFCN